MRSNQSILKEINAEYPLKGLMLKLKLQYFGHLMQRADSLEKTLMLGMIEGSRRRGWQRVKWLESITESMGMSLSKLRETVKDREAWGAMSILHSNSLQVGHNWTTEQQQKVESLGIAWYLEPTFWTEYLKVKRLQVSEVEWGGRSKYTGEWKELWRTQSCRTSVKRWEMSHDSLCPGILIFQWSQKFCFHIKFPKFLMLTQF